MIMVYKHNIIKAVLEITVGHQTLSDQSCENVWLILHYDWTYDRAPKWLSF